MWLKKSRPFALSTTNTPSSAALRRAIGAHDSLGKASAAWHDDLADDAPPAAATLGDDVAQAQGEARADRAYQAFLAPAAAPGATAAADQNNVSPESARLDVDTLEVGATRAITTLGGHGEMMSAAGVFTPYSTGIKLHTEIGDSKDTIGGLALVGKKAKTIGFETQVNPAAVGLAATLVADHKIQMLGPVQTSADGTAVRLVRFQSQAMPVLDANLSELGAQVGVGARAVFALGRGATYDKFVAVDQLSSMMRRRDKWYRNGVETLAAVGVMAGVTTPSRRSIAADMGKVDTMLPGEAVTWRTTKAMVLGLSVGSHGLRSTLTTQVQGHALLRLSRLDGDMVELCVQPIKILGLRAGVEARLVAEAAVEASTAAGKRRSWQFDLRYMSSRHALQRALRGQLPGIMLPGAPNTPREAYALLSVTKSERLPFGVKATGSEFMHSRQSTAGIAALRMPEILGGGSLEASTSRSQVAVGSVDAEGIGSFQRARSRNHSYNLLQAGSLDRQISGTLHSAVSIGPRGEARIRPLSVETKIAIETVDSGKFGRAKVATSLSDVIGRQLLPRNVQPTRRYTVEIVRSLGIDDLGIIAKTTDETISRMAAEHGVVSADAHKIATALRTAAAVGGEAAFAGALETITSLGIKGIKTLAVLAAAEKVSSATYEADVVNESHDQIIKDFFKAETFALGAKTHAHARKALQRLQRLEVQTNKAIEELQGDMILKAVSTQSAIDQRCALLNVLKDEVAQLARDVEASMDR